MHQLEAERVCKVSNNCTEQSLVESEFHFILACPAYTELRQAWLSKLVLPDNFVQISSPEKFKIFFNCAENLKPSAQFIVDAFNQGCKNALIFLTPGTSIFNLPRDNF